MALAATLTVTFEDDAGKTSRTKVRLPASPTIADLIDAGQQLIGLIADLTVGRIVAASICLGLDISGATIKAAASAAADVFTKGLFQFRSVVSGFFKRFNLPAFDESLVVAGTENIDTANSNVINFVTGIEAGLLTAGGTIQPVDSRGNDIDTLKFAKESVRASS